MAAKKPATRRAADKPRQTRELRRLSRQARYEVARLLKQEQAGIITRMDMKAGLQEVAMDLKRLMAFIFRL